MNHDPQPELPDDTPSEPADTPVDWEEVACTVGCDKFHRLYEDRLT